MTPAELAAVAWGMATRAENPMPVDVACEWLTDRADCDWDAAVKMVHGAAADRMQQWRTELKLGAPERGSKPGDGNTTDLAVELLRVAKLDEARERTLFISRIMERNPGKYQKWAYQFDHTVFLLRQLVPVGVPL